MRLSSLSLSDQSYDRIREQQKRLLKWLDSSFINAPPSNKGNETLKLSDRYWTCKNCSAFHDRDINAAINLKRLATKTALPVASHSAMNDTEIGTVSTSGGKVTPVRHECGQQDASGQEKNMNTFVHIFDSR